jgi:hypothetical protein
MVYKGQVHDGWVVLEGDVRLAEGTPVIVETVEATSLPAVIPDPVYRLGELAASTGIADLAMNIDHHLYGI